MGGENCNCKKDENDEKVTTTNFSTKLLMDDLNAVVVGKDRYDFTASEQDWDSSTYVINDVTNPPDLLIKSIKLSVLINGIEKQSDYHFCRLLAGIFNYRLVTKIKEHIKSDNFTQNGNKQLSIMLKDLISSNELDGFFSMLPANKQDTIGKHKLFRGFVTQTPTNLGCTQCIGCSMGTFFWSCCWC